MHARLESNEPGCQIKRTSVLLAFLSALYFKAFCRYITSVLPLNIGINLIFRDIKDYRKIKPAILLGD